MLRAVLRFVAGLIAAKPVVGGLRGGLNGVLQLSDVLPAGSAGQGPVGREVGVVKRRDAKADPGSPKKTRVGFS